MRILKGLLVVLFVFVGLVSFAQEGKNGSKAYNWKAKDIDGKEYSLSDFKGKYIMIDVWATWCGPCRNEIPFYASIVNKYKDKNIQFLSISVDNNLKKWKTFVSKEEKTAALQLIDEKATKSPAVAAYDITGIPRFIIIGKDGKIIEWNAARPSTPELALYLDKLLK